MVKHLIAAALAAVLLTWLSAAREPPPGPPRADAQLYARLGLGVADFGVLGRYVSELEPPIPTGDITPLYPMLVAALIRVDDGLARRLRCELSSGQVCSGSYASLVGLQVALLALFLLTIWALIGVYTEIPALGWIGMLAAWASTAAAGFTQSFLTEALALPLFGLFNLALVIIIKRPPSIRVAVAGGVALGLLVLTRPAYWYGFLAISAVLVVVGCWPRLRRRRAVPLLAICLSAAIVVSPWLVRNFVQFGQAQVSVGGYGGMALAQRVSYNAMTVPEFGVAFIYWLPDFGDTFAAALFPRRYFERLSFDDGSFYRTSPELIARTLALAGSQRAHIGYLLHHEVLAHPVVHALVSIPLAWRGMFIAKYWGLVAWLCLAAVLWRSSWRERGNFVLAGSPAFFMLIFQAAISVSIPRYNLTLLPVLSLAIAQQLLYTFARLNDFRRAPN